MIEEALASIHVRPPYCVTAMAEEKPAWRTNRLSGLPPDSYVFVHQPRGLYAVSRVGSVAVDRPRVISKFLRPTLVLEYWEHMTAFFALNGPIIASQLWGEVQNALVEKYRGSTEYVGPVRLVPVDARIIHHNPEARYSLEYLAEKAGRGLSVPTPK